MKAEFTAIIEPSPEGGFRAVCPEVPGANGQGETIEETKENLRLVIELILEDRRADILRDRVRDRRRSERTPIASPIKDSGFKDDVVKTNAVQILEQAGIVDARSLR